MREASLREERRERPVVCVGERDERREARERREASERGKRREQESRVESLRVTRVGEGLQPLFNTPRAWGVVKR